MTATQTPVPAAPEATEAATADRYRPRTMSSVALATTAALAVGAGVGTGRAVYVAVVLAACLALWLAFATERGLLYLLVLVPFGESLSVGPLTVGRMAAVLSVVVLTTRLVTGRLLHRAFPAITWVPAAGFAAVVIASGLWAADFVGWVDALGQVALALAFFAAYALLVTSPEQVTGLLSAYVLGAVFAAAIGFSQALLDLRAEGLQGDANIYALYQVAALPAAAALARDSRGAVRWLWCLAAVPILVSVVTSQSRGALLALLATIGFLAVLSRFRFVLVPLAAAAGLAAYTLAPLIDDRYAVDRVNQDRASGRIDIWHVAWQAWLDHPMTGLGAGNFVGQSIERLTTVPGVELLKSHLLTGKGIEVHNIYLEALAERGVLGLVTLVVFLLSVLWALMIARQRIPVPAVQALAPMLIAFCVAAFFLSVSNSKLLWMLAGLAAALLTPVTYHRTATASAPAARRTR